MPSVRYTEGTSYNAAQSGAANDFNPAVYTGVNSSYTVQVTNVGGISTILQLQNNDSGQGQNLYAAGSNSPTSYSVDFSDNIASVNLSGGNYGDVLRGGSGNDTLNGGGGNDVLEGGAGADTFNGGAGTDTVSFEHSTTPVQIVLLGQDDGYAALGDGNGDTWVGIENARGGSGDDTIGARDDTGRNVIEGGAGSDDLRGGAGDVASYLHSAQGVTVNLTTNVNTGGDAEGDTLIGIDNLYGSTHADSLTGNNSANTIRSFGGADTISGMGGNDRVFISETPTKVDGGDGFDVLNIEAGGTVTLGDDNFAGFERVLVFNGARVDMSDVSASTTNTPSGVSILSKSTSGNSASIYGTKGDDRIYGGDGSDVLRGGSGNDQIHAGEANQTIEGGTGNDLLFASTGSAQDTFNMMVEGFGRDTVRGSADALSNDVFNVDGLGSTLADLTFSKYGNGAIVTGTAGKAGDAVIFSNLTVDQAKGLNFHMDAGQPA